MRKSGKVRKNSPPKVRESQGLLSGHVSGNPAVIFPGYIGKISRISVLVKSRTNKISVIGNRLWSNIGNQLSAKYAIPGAVQRVLPHLGMFAPLSALSDCLAKVSLICNLWSI